MKGGFFGLSKSKTDIGSTKMNRKIRQRKFNLYAGINRWKSRRRFQLLDVLKKKSHDLCVSHPLSYVCFEGLRPSGIRNIEGMVKYLGLHTEVTPKGRHIRLFC